MTTILSTCRRLKDLDGLFVLMALFILAACILETTWIFCWRRVYYSWSCESGPSTALEQLFLFSGMQQTAIKVPTYLRYVTHNPGVLKTRAHRQVPRSVLRDNFPRARRGMRWDGTGEIHWILPIGRFSPHCRSGVRICLRRLFRITNWRNRRVVFVSRCAFML